MRGAMIVLSCIGRVTYTLCLFPARREAEPSVADFYFGNSVGGEGPPTRSRGSPAQAIALLVPVRAALTFPLAVGLDQ
jgi:hypothetical protein